MGPLIWAGIARALTGISHWRRDRPEFEAGVVIEGQEVLKTAGREAGATTLDGLGLGSGRALKSFTDTKRSL
jgi:hypothetical protein